jgi:hypothetical protein
VCKRLDEAPEKAEADTRSRVNPASGTRSL